MDWIHVTPGVLQRGVTIHAEAWSSAHVVHVRVRLQRWDNRVEVNVEVSSAHVHKIVSLYVWGLLFHSSRMLTHKTHKTLFIILKKKIKKKNLVSIFLFLFCLFCFVLFCFVKRSVAQLSLNQTTAQHCLNLIRPRPNIAWIRPRPNIAWILSDHGPT